MFINTSDFMRKIKHENTKLCFKETCKIVLQNAK